MKDLYRATKGHEEIMTRNLRYQRKQINDGIWRPIAVWFIVMAFTLMLISSVCDYVGLK